MTRIFESIAVSIPLLFLPAAVMADGDGRKTMIAPLMLLLTAGTPVLPVATGNQGTLYCFFENSMVSVCRNNCYSSWLKSCKGVVRTPFWRREAAFE